MIFCHKSSCRSLTAGSFFMPGLSADGEMFEPALGAFFRPCVSYAVRLKQGAYGACNGVGQSKGSAG
jgi:hypothetical protein